MSAVCKINKKNPKFQSYPLIFFSVTPMLPDRILNRTHQKPKRCGISAIVPYPVNEH